MTTKPRRNLLAAAQPTAVVVALTLLWGWIRLYVFIDTVFPLTFVLPLLVCVWTRRAWHLWFMATTFTAFALAEVLWLGPDGGDTVNLPFLAAMLLNITIGAAVVRALLHFRDHIDERNARLAAQFAELEAQAEELAQQNEEIRSQAEELTQQNEEIEAQAEELAGQNEELQQTNERLAHREEILQGLLESSRTPESGRAAIAEVCRRALRVIGSPAQCIAVLRRDADRLRIKAQAGVDHVLEVPDDWPIAGSIAELVLAQNRSAYVSDLQQEPKLAAPFGATAPARSVLATPMRIRGEPYGVVLACSRDPAHWTQDQFRVLEWVAAQCGLIAESLRWQTELTRRAEEIEAANHAKDQFLAMLSHELRTPLTPVLAAAGVLEHDERIPEDVRDDLRMIRRNIGIQSRLIDDLLDVTKLERGKLALEKRVLGIASLLHETALIVAPELDAKDQRIELDLAAAEGRYVEGDGPRLQQVFWNLLKNAIKFSPIRARIRLETEVEQAATPRLAIRIIDSGIGIAPDDIERIFRPFEQVAADGKQRSGDSGLGLGLSIAKAIVDLHGGAISVASDGIGRGARFTVQLPLVRKTAPVPRLPGSRGPHPTAGDVNRALRILLVEDHADTGRILARLLRHAGHQVDYAETAQAAFDLFTARPFDLVISDLGLPDESGIDLMKKLRVRQPELFGICLSGYGMEDDLLACRDAGFAEHLTKPVDMQRLHAAIGRAAAALSSTPQRDGTADGLLTV